MITSIGQLLSQDSEIGMILQTLFSFAFIIYLFYAQRIQAMTMLRQIETTLRKVKGLRDKGKKVAIESIREIGKPEQDPTPQVERFMEHFMIPPVDMDPAGVVGKLGTILNVREFTFEKEVAVMAPNASESERNNLENLLEAGLALNVFYKVIRHFYLLGKKTLNIYIIMQIHMILPLILQQIEAYSAALQAFQDGIPIGDSVGPIVAAKLMNGSEIREVAKEMVAGEIEFEKRRVIVTKAKGPGGSVGKPGDAITNLLEENKGKVAMLITVDAAGKLEGEQVGEIAEGVGAAIGGPGVEKYKIEKAAIENNVPLHAVAIKQGMEHVVAPLVEPLFEATEKAVASVKSLILDYSKEGDTVIVAGIGNTVGVGQ
jgi:hypothetical protein